MRWTRTGSFLARIHAAAPPRDHHWLAVYEELHRFKLDLIGHMRERMGAVNPSARHELEDVDLAILLRESERLDRRLRFWQARATELVSARTR